MAARIRITPTTRTLQFLEARGYIADICERRQGPISRDLFGCIDIVAAHPRKREVLFIQVTSHSHRASRLAKTAEAPKTIQLLRSGALVEVWTWANEDAQPHITRLRADRNPEAPREGQGTTTT